MVAVLASTMVGNSLVVRALWCATPRAPAHYLLASLAIADLLLGLTVQPLAAAEELYPLHIEGGWCAWWRAMDVLCCTASILSLCALGWERHEGVSRPLERARRAARARLVAVFVWPISIAVAAPAAFVPFKRHPNAGEIPRACVVNNNIEYVLFSVTFSFYVPAALALAMYWRVIRELRSLPPLRAHRGRSIEPPHNTNSSPFRFFSACRFRSPNYTKQDGHPHGNPELFLSPKGNHLSSPWVLLGDMLSPSSSRSNSSRSNSPLIETESGSRSSEEMAPPTTRQARATRTIVLLMSLFLICWSPFFVVLPLDTLVGCVTARAMWCATWLGYANSAVNPLVYAATSPTLRRALSASAGSSTRSSELQLTPARSTRSHSPRARSRTPTPTTPTRMSSW